MDSLTQFVLGAAVGVAVMGRQQSVVKSALIGGLAGTLPDLDAFYDYGDAIENMVRHRGETHSLFWQTIAAPFIATVIALIDRSLHLFFRWWMLVWLALITHAGLDAMTVYGTQLLLPQDNTPFGVGSIFIIDPLYTIPLILGLLVTLLQARHRVLKWNLIGLLLSSAYLGWSYYAQQEVLRVVQATPAAQGLPRDKILVTPTAFNTIVWRILLMRDDRYEEGFYSLTDRFVAPERPLTFEQYRRYAKLDQDTARFDSANDIRRFSKGFYTVSRVGDSVRVTDLRMGQEPYYVFSFEFARRKGLGFEAVTPTNVGNRGDIPVQDLLQWLTTRMQGIDARPPR